MASFMMKYLPCWQSSNLLQVVSWCYNVWNASWIPSILLWWSCNNMQKGEKTVHILKSLHLLYSSYFRSLVIFRYCTFQWIFIIQRETLIMGTLSCWLLNNYFVYILILTIICHRAHYISIKCPIFQKH